MKHSCQYGDFQLMASKVKSAMEDERFIPFVPRSIRHAAKLATQLCERTLDILAPGLASALDPFPEASVPAFAKIFHLREFWHGGD